MELELNNNKYSLTDLKYIKHDDGDLIKGLKSSDKQFFNFGESYYSWVISGKKKAWRMHKKITNNFVIINGTININIIRDDGLPDSIIAESAEAQLITIFPHTWYGFEAISPCDALIHNITDYEYSEDEILRKDLDAFEGVWKR